MRGTVLKYPVLQYRISNIEYSMSGHALIRQRDGGQGTYPAVVRGLMYLNAMNPMQSGSQASRIRILPNEVICKQTQP